MSLIYDSLKKTAEPIAPPPVAAIQRRARLIPIKVLRRLAVGLGILGACIGAGWGLVVWMQGEVERLGPRLQAARAIEPVPSTETPAPPAPSPQPAAPPVELRPATPPPPPAPVRTKIGIEDLARPTLELEQVFAQRARHNQRVLELERDLTAAWSQGDLVRVRASLASLRQLAGPQSPMVRRWEGMLTLREGDARQAEAIFRGLLAEGRTDLTTRLLLARALLAQGQSEAARQEVRQILDAHPDNQEAKRLWSSLAEAPGRGP